MIKSEKGASAVEFALLAPLLFVLTFGIIEFSLMLFDKAILINASREGARAAIVYNMDYSSTSTGSAARYSIPEIQNIVKNYANQYLVNFGSASRELTNDDIPIVYAGGTASPGTLVTVSVNYSYNFLVFSSLIKLLGGSSSGAVNIGTTTVMRMECSDSDDCPTTGTGS